MRLAIFFLLIFSVLASHSQVQVSQEPRHHKVLDNEWVRVLDVHIPPHDTTMMHKHSTPSVFLILSSTRTGSQVLIEPGKTSFADGNIWFESFKDTPRIHRVWNEDTVEFHVMDIELPHGLVSTPASVSAASAPAASSAPAATSSVPAAASSAPFFVMDPPHSKQLFDTRSVRVYRLTVPPGLHLAMPRSQSPILVISLSGPAANGIVNHQPFTKKGDYLFLPGNSPLAIANDGSAEHQFAILYLK